MEITIPSKIYDIYIEQHRNLDMALTTLLDNFDPETYEKVFNITNPIKIKEKDETITVKIGEKVITQIKDSFSTLKTDNDLINSLLWIAILFPEI